MQLNPRGKEQGGKAVPLDWRNGDKRDNIQCVVGPGPLPLADGGSCLIWPGVGG